jgi:hypothetical protein
MKFKKNVYIYIYRLTNIFSERAWKYLSTKKSDHKICNWKKRRKNVLDWKQLQNVCLRLANTRFVRTVNITVCYCVQYSVWNRGKENFHITYVSWISGIKINMLMIVLLGLIVKLTLFSGECELGTTKLQNFNWTKVSTVVLTCLN